ncbi:multidrug efflux SMR transporter [Heyndrickxia oleronia]|jgi:paired small multidrug resistance pump|uniref:Multidrug efflux SMR transporter n=1 Tax=Heyndrickxia oleronia TaxID=38875 RepID=A0A8E2LBH6_9BACI|nr:multidrug efflux SMR transporter [Heyndrickxia oleronia]NYV66961.1 multidrug efflux SMR transporter [Bacillus sp. Gen3]OJH15919.1 QacE family quaternary ammonium compound efflux SMR transporter [Bacillus obstructivus]MBU5211216.1 multidrug efflux SMR transporter [Heyndrickxia oleronia]MCM3454083.1 multidrug efflux SMR transporter [Heyndrickxia oleronia]MDH5162564.1 multidrug efflux SMR transporter [Heyndrickxia oleronia]
MAWIYLILAGIGEMLGVMFINKLHKDRNLLSFLLLFLGFGGSFLFLALAMESLPMGTAYAIWTGIGASGGAILGMIFYGEQSDWKRISCIALVVAAAVGLKLIS